MSLVLFLLSVVFGAEPAPLTVSEKLKAAEAVFAATRQALFDSVPSSVGLRVLRISDQVPETLRQQFEAASREVAASASGLPVTPAQSQEESSIKLWFRPEEIMSCNLDAEGGRIRLVDIYVDHVGGTHFLNATITGGTEAGAAAARSCLTLHFLYSGGFLPTGLYGHRYHIPVPK